MSLRGTDFEERGALAVGGRGGYCRRFRGRAAAAEASATSGAGSVARKKTKFVCAPLFKTGSRNKASLRVRPKTPHLIVTNSTTLVQGARGATWEARAIEHAPPPSPHKTHTHTPARTGPHSHTSPRSREQPWHSPGGVVSRMFPGLGGHIGLGAGATGARARVHPKRLVISSSRTPLSRPHAHSSAAALPVLPMHMTIGLRIEDWTAAEGRWTAAEGQAGARTKVCVAPTTTPRIPALSPARARGGIARPSRRPCRSDRTLIALRWLGGVHRALAPLAASPAHPPPPR
jgi:hypothetical protein